MSNGTDAENNDSDFVNATRGHLGFLVDSYGPLTRLTGLYGDEDSSVISRGFLKLYEGSIR